MTDDDLIRRGDAIQALSPMLRDMISRGQACRALSSVPAVDPAPMIAAARAKVLEEAAGAVDNERLTDNTGEPDDEAYNQAIDDSYAAIYALITTDEADALAEVKRQARVEGMWIAMEACRQAETDWNAIAYDKRQAGKDDNFACASASASGKNASIIAALIAREGGE